MPARPARGPNRRGAARGTGAALMSFTDSSGATVQARDVVCQRHLEGRTCLSWAELQQARREAVDVVVVPIPTARAAAAAATAGDGPVDAARADAAQGTLNHAICDTRLAQHAARLAELLRASGVAAHLDDAPSITPGAKFHAWERRGVRVRLEVGDREVQQGGATLHVRGMAADAFEGLGLGTCSFRPSTPNLLHCGCALPQASSCCLSHATRDRRVSSDSCVPS